jgi:hypothetical protein
MVGVGDAGGRGSRLWRRKLFRRRSLFILENDQTRNTIAGRRRLCRRRSLFNGCG